MTTYNDIGVKRIINAAGTYTKFSGSLMKEEVLDAMKDASKQFVNIDELLNKSGNYIAKLLGAEAALITAGAASGLTLSTAACIAGFNKNISRQLPINSDLKNEFIIMKSHRNPYDQAVITAGGKFVEIGNSIETFDWELETAITEKTAGVFFFVQSDMFRASLDLREVLKISHKYNLPVIVDAAAELPPKENLTKFINQGADIVLFSGGKDLRGPQSSGLMLGNKDLIEKCKVNGYPNHSVGRPMKLDKETIMGLTTAIELYLEEDQKKRMYKWEEKAKYLYEKLKDIGGFEIRLDYPDQPLTQPASIPRLFVLINEDILGLNKYELKDKLAQNDPAIIIGCDKNHLLINPHMIQDEEEKTIVEAIKNIIKEANS